MEGCEDNTDFKNRNNGLVKFFDLQKRVKSRTTAQRKESFAPLTLNNIRNFVCAASFLLVAWLGLTFVSKVPYHRYPSLGRGSESVSITLDEDAPLAAAVVAGKKGIATFSVAH